ncbi:MAG: signal peptidase II [Gammaproteobacteria bacterium]|nr:signal peptidase II [Gammaproteobacteria bacterium]
MRVIWISVAVILLDQLSKYLLHLSQLSENIHWVKGEMTLVVAQNSGITAAQLNAALLNSPFWMLLGGMVTMLLLIARWHTLFHFITLRTILGLQLAAGGLLSYTLDYVLRGHVQGTVELQLYNVFTLNTGVADLALMGGLLLLVQVLSSGAVRITSKVALLRATGAKLDLSPLPRGVDNIHIDVHLSAEFCRQAAVLVQQLVNSAITAIRQGAPRSPLPATLFTPLKKSFLALHQDALHKAKSSGEPQRIDLFYIALIKFIHDEVTNCVVARVRKTKETVQEHHKRGLGGNQDSHYVKELFRHQEAIIATVNQRLLNGLVENQLPNLEKGIRGFLGKERSFAMELMRSPLVTSGAPDVEQIQFQHYLLFGHGKYAAMSFLQLDRALDDVLHDHLHLVADEDVRESGWEPGSREFDSGNTTAEILSRPSVLMHPANALLLLEQQWTRNKIAKTGRIREWRQFRIYRTHLHFQRRLAKQLIARLRQAGFARWLAAIHEARPLLQKSSSDISPTALVTLLLECGNKKELLQRLEMVGRGINGDELVQRWEALNTEGEALLQRHLATLIRDFSRYRRDLLLLYKFHRAASQIKLRQDEKTLQTSRANYTLYEFVLATEKGREPTAIRSHIIIKADLRGSTEVTDRLNQLALNPATHFDRNFFSPINEVIDQFGAEKVFIEGDAIILILNDYLGTAQQPLIASRACALAAGILHIVARQNRELLCYGLPKLELGIGIAYCNEPPRFLFDGDHKITISPAINRADRLSACAWSVRDWRERQAAPPTRVEVYQPSERALGHGEKAQKDLVYNLDGILIEAEIFEQLHKELTPKRILNTLPDKQESTLFAIKVPGANGKTSSLIIRKAPVKLYDPAYRVAECPVVAGRYFHEIIYDRETLDALRHRPARG